MPSSKLNKLEIKTSIYYSKESSSDEDDTKDSDIDVALVEGQEIKLKLVIKESNGNNGLLTDATRFYYCQINSSTRKQLNQLYCTQTCDATCQHDDTDFFKCTCRSSINFSIVCKPLKVLELVPAIGGYTGNIYLLQLAGSST